MYATVSSERATKGQGGNTTLRTSYTVELKDGSRKELLVLSIIPCAAGYSISMASHHGDVLYEDTYIDTTQKKAKSKQTRERQ